MFGSLPTGEQFVADEAFASVLIYDEKGFANLVIMDMRGLDLIGVAHGCSHSGSVCEFSRGHGRRRMRSLARFLQAALVKRTGAVDRGMKAEQFYVIANVRHPAALVPDWFPHRDGGLVSRDRTSCAVGAGGVAAGIRGHDAAQRLASTQWKLARPEGIEPPTLSFEG